MRIRNPWGNETEWNGAWSDGSAEWQYIPDDEKENIGLNFENDGEFWMSYKDFRSMWDQLEICNLSPHALEDCSEHVTWQVKQVEGMIMQEDILQEKIFSLLSDKILLDFYS